MEEASPNSLEQLANLNPLLPLEQDQKDLVLGEGSWGIARNQEPGGERYKFMSSIGS